MVSFRNWSDSTELLGTRKYIALNACVDDVGEVRSNDVGCEFDVFCWYEIWPVALLDCNLEIILRTLSVVVF